MSAKSSVNHECSAPSVQDRIIALDEHNQLFETIAVHPQAGIYRRFGKEWALVLAYIEGEVHRCERAARSFIRENARTVREAREESTLQVRLNKLMEDLIDKLLLHCRAVRDSREMALSSPPSMLFMDEYRMNSASGQESMRAANGEMPSIYGKEKEPIPVDFTTLNNEDLEPIAQFLVNWVMEPFIVYIGTPLSSLCLTVPLLRRIGLATVEEKKVVNARTISAIARAMMCVMAILSLIAPIAALDAIENPKLRIVVMAVFAQAFAASVQFMGAGSIPMAMLITAYFQVMVVFVGTTSEQKIRQ